MATPFIIASRYALGPEIGRGGMGVVYRAERLDGGPPLAVKVLSASLHADPVAQQRFRREAMAASAIGSPHVVKVFEAAVAPELDGAPFIAMELVGGESLRALLDRRGHLTAPEVVALMAQLCAALACAHERRIVHRDLKPENLMCRSAGGPPALMVLDFGLAKVLEDPSITLSATAALTSTGELVGTPCYMAPEQAGSPSELDTSVDLWAVGMITFELLTGQRYWSGRSAGEVAHQVLCAPIEPPSALAPGIGPAFDAWFLQSCARDPDARHPDALRQLSALAGALGVPLPSPAH